MDDQREMDLEARIQSLLCNDLGEEERDALLKRIATEEEVRKVLMNLLTCREESRAACGYDGMEPVIRGSFAEFSKTLQGSRVAVEGSDTRRRDWRTFIWPLVTAAAVLVAVYFGVISQPGSPVGSGEEMASAQVTPHELATYRRIWDEVVVPSGGEAAWILMDKDSGRFEFMPDGKTGEVARPAVLRCRIQSITGETLGNMDLLLTVGKPMAIALGQTGELAGEPVRCSVTGEGDNITVALLIGKDKASSVGLQGKVRMDRDMADVGCVRLDNRDMRVLLQAVTLHGRTS